MTGIFPNPPIEKAQQQERQFQEPSLDALPTNSPSPNSHKSQQHGISLYDFSNDSRDSNTVYSSAGILENARIKRSTLSMDIKSQADHDVYAVDHDLLNKVVEMQDLLEEYQHTLTELEIEKEDKKQEIDKLDKLLKGKGETEEKYKDEIWNLELNKQELLQKNYELSQRLSKSATEQNRLANEEARLCQEIEHFKTIQHDWEANLAHAQEQHEQEMIALKKTLHTIRAEKDQISKQFQQVVALQHEAAQQQAPLRHVDCPTPLNNANVAHHPTTLPTISRANKVFDDNSLSSKLLASKHEVEIRALKTSLDQAHEIILTMQAKIDEEKLERIEVDKLLREAQETIEQFNNQDLPSTPRQQQNFSPTMNRLLSPSSPASISSRHQRTSLRLSRNTSQKRIRLAIASSSPYFHRGKSLCDELSQAGSTGNFIALSPFSSKSPQTSNSNSDTKLNDECNIIIDQGKPSSSLYSYNPSKEKAVTLSCVEMPSFSNHDLFSLSPSTSIVDEISNNNKEQYGSYITEPESYIYKSKRKKHTTEKQKQGLSLFKSTFKDTNFNIDVDFIKQKKEEDHDVTAAITHTMIGDWMWKYTRKVVGSGMSKNKHRRFFWIHPYTHMLYWCTQKPGIDSNQCSTKSVLVKSFYILDSHDDQQAKPPSIYIKTASRAIQIQCLDFTAHYTWVASLEHLLSDNEDHTHYIASTTKNAHVGRKRFSSLRLKNRSFIKLFDQSPSSLPDSSATKFGNDNHGDQEELEANLSENECKRRQTLQTVLDNSTLVDLSTVNQRPFIDSNILKHR